MPKCNLLTTTSLLPFHLFLFNGSTTLFLFVILLERYFFSKLLFINVKFIQWQYILINKFINTVPWPLILKFEMQGTKRHTPKHKNANITNTKMHIESLTEHIQTWVTRMISFLYLCVFRFCIFRGAVSCRSGFLRKHGTHTL